MDPGNWRGIEPQSHLRKTYEHCLPFLMSSRSWLSMHVRAVGTPICPSPLHPRLVAQHRTG